MKLYDPKQVKLRFNRSANSYDEQAALSHEIGERLLTRLELIKINPEMLVDLGSGTGYFIEKLQKSYPQAKIIAVDFAEKMLAKTPANIMQHLTHASVLPFPDQSVDFVFSNLMLPWSDNLPSIFQEVSRVLKPEGLFFFSTFGPDSFKEIHQAWFGIDKQIHAHHFYDMHDIGDALGKAGLTDVVMEVEHLSFTYADAQTLVNELKAIGFSNVSIERSKGLLGKNKWQQFLQQYPKNKEGRCPLSLEVVYGHAWGRRIQEKPASDEVPISLDDLYRKVKK